MEGIDALRLSFDQDAQAALQWVLALIMFGVALDMRKADFTRILRMPTAPLIGLLCQFLLMPALAFLILRAMQVAPSLALGMILVAACPGGNLSNFLTSLSRGTAAVSVTMSAVSTLAAIVMTPLNFAMWGAFYPGADTLLREVSIEPLDVLQKVTIILLIPTLAGMLFAAWLPAIAKRLKAPMRWASMGVFLLFVAGGFAANWSNFIEYIGYVFVLVAIVNAAGFALGFGLARLLRQQRADAKAIAFETGIQNTGFGLILALQFFSGIGGIALVAAWWGIWHILSGLALALWWRRRDAPAEPVTVSG